MKRISSITTSLLLLGLLAVPVWAQTTTIRGGIKGTSTADPVTSTSIDANKTGLDVNLVGGSVSISGADGALLDGVTSTIKATVKDYTNSNPLTVIPVDTNGDPASLGGGTQYQQGSAATDTDTMTMAGCVRADTAAVATGVVDGDRARCIVDATGRMWVHVGTIDGGTITTITNPVTITDGAGALNVIVDSSALPSGASTLAEQQTQTTSLQLIDDVVHASDAALSKGIPIFCQFDNTSPGTTTENNVRPVRCSTLRELFGIIRDAAGNERGANVNASNQLSVSVDNTPNVGTVTTVTTVSTLTNITNNNPSGGTAHDGAAAAVNPLLTGCYASAAAPTDVSADNDATREWCLRNGARAVQPTFAGVLQSTGNGTAGTGTPRVTIASDNTAFSVNNTQQGTASQNVAQVNGSTVQVASNGLNTTGTGLLASAAVGQCDDTSPTALTENQFGHARINCTTHHALVEVGAALPTGSNTIGALSANQSVNLAQVGGTNTVTGGVNGSLGVGGHTAHDAVMAGNPVTISGYAETAEDSDGNTNANRVSADGDVTRLLTDRNGTLFVRNGPPHRWSYHEDSSSALTDTTVHASCGTGLYNYIESVTASTGAATAWNIFIEDSTTTKILGPYYLEAVAGRGLHVTYPGGKKQTNSATLISVTTSAAIAHSIDIIGFCAP